MRLKNLVRVSTLCAALAAASLPAGAEQEVKSTRVLDREAVTARFTDAASKFIEVDGVKVHYKDHGTGPAVLLVHGTMGDVNDWNGWAEQLSKRYRVLRFDIPGLGLSGPIASGNYSTDRIATLIDGFMDLMGEERFSIAGVSYGGLIAFRYAATRTGRVNALIIGNSAGIEYGKAAAATEVKKTEKTDTPAKPLDGNIFYSEVVTDKHIEANLRHMLANHALITPALIERKLNFANITGRGHEARVSRAQYERADPQRVLAHVKAPALVLWGGANKALSVQTADAFVSAMKNACRVERKFYPEAGHMLMMDMPQQTSADVLAFLDTVSAGAPCRPAAAKR